MTNRHHTDETTELIKLKDEKEIIVGVWRRIKRRFLEIITKRTKQEGLFYVLSIG